MFGQKVATRSREIPAHKREEFKDKLRKIWTLANNQTFVHSASLSMY